MVDPKVNPNRLNIYVCDNCGNHIVTRDMAQGTTPFMIGCQCIPTCRGRMRSSMYHVFDPDGKMHHTHEWYRPEPSEREALSPFALDHVSRGGLLLRARLDSKANLDAGFKATHKHKGNGNSYQVLGVAGLQINEPKEPEGVEFILYQGQDGRYWVWPKAEFEEQFDALQ